MTVTIILMMVAHKAVQLKAAGNVLTKDLLAHALITITVHSAYAFLVIKPVIIVGDL
jgi:hypothetical protein